MTLENIKVNNTRVLGLSQDFGFSDSTTVSQVTVTNKWNQTHDSLYYLSGQNLATNYICGYITSSSKIGQKIDINYSGTAIHTFLKIDLREIDEDVYININKLPKNYVCYALTDENYIVTFISHLYYTYPYNWLVDKTAAYAFINLTLSAEPEDVLSYIVKFNNNLVNKVQELENIITDKTLPNDEVRILSNVNNILSYDFPNATSKDNESVKFFNEFIESFDGVYFKSVPASEGTGTYYSILSCIINYDKIDWCGTGDDQYTILNIYEKSAAKQFYIVLRYEVDEVKTEIWRYILLSESLHGFQYLNGSQTADCNLDNQELLNKTPELLYYKYENSLTDSGEKIYKIKIPRYINNGNLLKFCSVCITGPCYPDGIFYQGPIIVNYATYSDNVPSNIYLQKEIDELKEGGTGGDGVTTVNIKNSDKFAFYGCSYTESYYAMKKKDWVNKLSNLLDIQCHNFGQSGNRIVDISARIRANSNPYASVGIKELGPTYIFIQNIGNETLENAGTNTDFYLAEVVEATELIKAMGAQPIFSTDFYIGNKNIDILFDEYGKKYGYLSYSIGSVVEQYANQAYSPFWYGHPGTRTNSAIANDYFNWLTNINVRQGIKIFRVRDEYKNGSPSLADLNYDTNEQRYKIWNEINTGAISLQEHAPNNNGWEYYDRINEINNYVAERNSNEYCTLIDHNNVEFNKYALIEYILPKVKCSKVEIFIKSSNNDLKFYVKNSINSVNTSNRLGGMVEVTKEVYNQFADIPFNRLFTQDQTNLFFKGRYKNNAFGTYYLSLETGNSTLDLPAGNITDSVTGTTYAHQASNYALSRHGSVFYDNNFKALSDFVEINSTYEEDLYTVKITNYNFIQYDKIRLIISRESEDDFVISNTYCQCTGGENKVYNRNMFEKIKYSGEKLINTTSFGANSYNNEWTLTGNAVYKKYTQNTQYPTGNINSDKSYISLGFDNDGFSGKMSKTISFTSQRGYRDIVVRVSAQNYPKIYNTTQTPGEIYTNVRQITASSYDYATLCLGVGVNGAKPAVLRRIVDICWAEIEYRVKIPPFTTSVTLSLWRDDEDLNLTDYKSKDFELMVCDVSCELL